MCRSCGETDEAKFYRRTGGGFRTPCKACCQARRVEYDKQNAPEIKASRACWVQVNRQHVNARNLCRMSRRRAELTTYINELKTAPCTKCRRCFPPCCMDYDHVRGQKRAPVAILVARCVSVETLLAEIAKCELLCANCHRVKTAQDRPTWSHTAKDISSRIHTHRQELRRIVAEAKSTPCGDCNESFPPCAMDFDHTDPGTKRNKREGSGRQGPRKSGTGQISWLVLHNVSVATLRREILKCRVICANCHRIRTRDQ